MKTAKTILAGILSVAMLCSITGCKEREKLDSSSGDGATYNEAEESVSSTVEETSKTFSEVLEQLSNIASYNFITDLTLDYTSVSDEGADDNIVESEITQKSVALSINGCANNNGDFAISDFVVDADLGGGTGSFSLGDAVVIDENIYINVYQILSTFAEIADTEMPVDLKDLEYVVITAGDIQNLGELIEQQLSSSDSLVSESTVESPSIDSEVVEEAFTYAVDTLAAFVKNVCKKSESLVICEDNTYTITLNKSNYMAYMDIILSMIEDGSLKNLINDITESFLAIPGVSLGEMEDVDSMINKWKTYILEINDENILDFSITYTLTIPTAENNSYVGEFSADIPDENGNPIAIAMRNTLIPQDKVSVIVPTNVLTVEEFMQKAQGIIEGYYSEVVEPVASSDWDISLVGNV